MSKNRLVQFAGICVAVLYGIVTRLFFSLQQLGDLFGIMTLAFIFVVPFVLGYLMLYFQEHAGKLRWRKIIFEPWATLIVMAAIAWLFAWEGIICVVMWLPIALIMSSLGGALGALARSFAEKKMRRAMLTSCLALPFVIAPVERQFDLPRDLRTVKTHIIIHAPASTIWENIKQVPAIQAGEHETGFVQRIGFPKPVSATLSHEGPGAIRHATFEGNVLFIETISHWEPNHRLAFAIQADTKNIPAVTLDEHVTIGGPYFDVLEGEYEIEVIDAETAVLHLLSKHRLSTHFNFYAHWWSDFIMADIQNNILKIIKKRCERRE